MESGRNVQEIALNNPIILTQIMKQTSTPLLTCRQVCKFWNDIVLTLPNPRLALKLNHEGAGNNNDLVPFFDLCFTLDPRLAKRIRASTCEAIHSFAAKLTYFCEKFTNNVQILEVSIEYESCVKSVLQILQNFCPNLKQCWISCKFGKSKNFKLHPREEKILHVRIPIKSNLTLFTLRARKVTPFLTNFVDMVLAAAPNLSGITLPWGVCPDLGNSTVLESLKVEVDGRVGPCAMHVADEILTNLSKMVDQVRDQLVTLSFGYVGRKRTANLRWLEPENGTRFHLPGRMAKLQNFRNEMAEIFGCGDLLRNVETLKSLAIGNIFLKSGRVSEILRGIFANKIFGSVSTLALMEVYGDPCILDGLRTAFPNVMRFEMDTYHYLWPDFCDKGDDMKLGAILAACGGWGRLTYLKVTMAKYPYKIGDMIRNLLDAKELYAGLKTLQILTHDGIHPYHELTEDEADSFKQVIAAMDGMDEVSIPELHVREFRPVAAEWCGRTEGQCPLHVPMLYVLTLPSQSYHFIVLTASTVKFSSKSEELVRNFVASTTKLSKFNLIAGDPSEEKEDSD